MQKGKYPIRDGVLYGLAAYLWWGLVPLYFYWLGKIDPLGILAHRIVWSAVFLGLILTIGRRWPEAIRALRTPKILLPLCASAVLVAFNWWMYILGVYFEIIVLASLGYFILPLVSVVLGMLVFGERLRPLQWLAIGCAVVGVCLLTWSAGGFPWLAAALAVSFAFYGMIRKQVNVDGLIGLSIETVILLPIAAGYLAVNYSVWSSLENAELFGKLILSGVVTAVPLLCFGQAARRLPLSLLGFMQYLSPSVQFLLAILVFGEEVIGGWLCYAVIWSALVIYSLESFLWYRQGTDINADVSRQAGQENA